MNDLKSALIKLLTIYVVIVGSVAVLGALLALLTGRLSGHNGGFPLPLVPIITIGTALVLLGIFVCIAIGMAVYHDASRRNMEPMLWALVAALVPYFLGLIAYLIARKPNQEFCSECGGAVPEHSTYCPHCGHSNQKPCPGCSRPVEPSMRFCPFCGAGIGTVEAGE